MNDLNNKLLEKFFGFTRNLTPVLLIGGFSVAMLDIIFKNSNLIGFNRILLISVAVSLLITSFFLLVANFLTFAKDIEDYFLSKFLNDTYKYKNMYELLTDKNFMCIKKIFIIFVHILYLWLFICILTLYTLKISQIIK